MNAVIALCSFCELHGPSVLFCTQAFHEDTEALEFSSAQAGKNKSTTKKDWYGPEYFINHASSMGSGSIFPPLKSTNCEGCTSMTDETRGFIDNDHEARVSYVSGQYPLHPDVFSIVRQACVRSLSCEVCPGREGPIFFGDDDRGHVLSHTFFMKDSQARGLQSWYSIIIVMMDKMFLLNSWQFLVKNLQVIIQEMQQKALEVFTGEQSENNQRSVRLNSASAMTLDTFRRRRGNVKARSIIHLTNDKDIFKKLHEQFSWILKAGAERICEKLVESFPCEDAIVDLERQEETEEGFIKVHIKKGDNDCLHAANHRVPEEAENKHLPAENCHVPVEAVNKNLHAENCQVSEKAVNKHLYAENCHVSEEAENKQLHAENCNVSEEAENKHLHAENCHVSKDAENKNLHIENRHVPEDAKRIPDPEGEIGIQFTSIRELYQQ